MVERTLTRVLFGGILAFAMATATSSCETRTDSRGNLPDPDKLAAIEPGRDSRDDVVATLGSPSSIAVFDDEVWYYISERTETFAFFAPELMERQVAIVRFGKDGLVTAVENIGLDRARQIEPVDRKTPTVGKELTVLDQLFGNLGRFQNKKQKPRPKQ